VRSALSTLTTRGRAFVSAGIASAGCAIVLGQRDLLRVGLLLLALPVITALLANRSRYLLSCTRQVLPPRVQVDSPAIVSLTLDNPGRVPTGLMLLEDALPYALGSRPRFVVDQLRPRWHREMSYSVRSQVRGRYNVGPLTVRLSDPFGFVELTRAFTSQATLVVTPVVVPLPRVRLSGDWSGTGDNRPRAFAAAGTEDVTVREYRMGDDLRRIHWPSTARTDELMVRREEQPYQSRATLVLDTRATAHRGSGPSSSFEYAVSAAASIASHLTAQGFTVRMLTDDVRAAEATWHDRGTGGAAEARAILDALAVIEPSRRGDFSSASVDRGSTGLVVAVVGALSSADLAALSTLRAGATRALAIVLDVATWTGSGSSPRAQVSAADRVSALRHSGWSAVPAGPRDQLPSLWQELAARPELTSSGSFATRGQSGPAGVRMSAG
jgi:uncharacterized protein (DUF58 family)